MYRCEVWRMHVWCRGVATLHAVHPQTHLINSRVIRYDVEDVPDAQPKPSRAVQRRLQRQQKMQQPVKEQDDVGQGGGEGQEEEG